MTPRKKDEFQKYVDKFAEDMALLTKDVTTIGLALKEVKDIFYNALNVSRLPIESSQPSFWDDMPSFPNIDDFTPEATRKRQLKALEHSIRRKRKLSAEDMLKIYVLHTEKRVSFRSIAKQLNVSEWTVRKTFQKVESVLRKVNNDKWLKINYENL